jgi:hypothetical protein
MHCEGILDGIDRAPHPGAETARRGQKHLEFRALCGTSFAVVLETICCKHEHRIPRRSPQLEG